MGSSTLTAPAQHPCVAARARGAARSGWRAKACGTRTFARRGPGRRSASSVVATEHAVFHAQITRDSDHGQSLQLLLGRGDSSTARASHPAVRRPLHGSTSGGSTVFSKLSLRFVCHQLLRQSQSRRQAMYHGVRGRRSVGGRVGSDDERPRVPAIARAHMGKCKAPRPTPGSLTAGPAPANGTPPPRPHHIPQKAGPPSVLDEAARGQRGMRVGWIRVCERGRGARPALGRDNQARPAPI